MSPAAVVLPFALVLHSLATSQEPAAPLPGQPARRQQAQQPERRAVSLFDGATLAGWDGDPAIWSVQDGCITGSTVGRELAANTFLVWRGRENDSAEIADFEFECEVRLVGDNNSGIQYRARRLPGDGFRVHGYQCDVHPEPAYLGMLYEEGGRGIVARHGERLHLPASGGRRALGALHAPRPVDLAQWHRLKIVARGRTLQHFVDGELCVEVTDDAPQFVRQGVLALQVHAGAPMTVSFRGLRLVRLPTEEVAAVAPGAAAGPTATAGPAVGAGPAGAPFAGVPGGAVPNWIWDEAPGDGEDLFFRRPFVLDAVPASALLFATCDNHCRVYVNGERVVQSRDWTAPRVLDVRTRLRPGENVIAVHGTNEGGPAGLCAALVLAEPGGAVRSIVTDAEWRCADDDRDGWNTVGYAADGWRPARVLAPLGQGPWAASLPLGVLGELLVLPEPQPPSPAPELTLADGFAAQRLLRVPRLYGSWVCLAADPHGRLYASDQQRGLYRIRPARPDAAPGSEAAVTTVEPVEVDIGGCQGLAFAFGALYAVAHGERAGLYRITDTDGDDALDRAELLLPLRGGGEHGPHAVVPAHDGEHLFVLCGNHTRLPELARSRLPRNWADDVLQPKIEDPNGHAVGIPAPGGFVLSVDRDGRDVELFCAGFRNAYDLALLPDGEMITYDADMEWDMGLPWYRPTRILHVVSGADYGWRSGSSKWSPRWPDTLPPVVDIGPGSPTGMVWTARGALALDWTFGTIYRLAPRARGSSVSADVAEWATGQPLPVADAVVAGGALYLLTGGRGIPSTLYAIRPTGAPAAALPATEDGRAARELRRRLESWHGRTAAGAVDDAWPHLEAADAFVRHAARLAVEAQPVAGWRERALQPQRATWGTLTALLALARQGEAADLAPLCTALAAIDPAALDAEQRLALVRVCQLAVLRLGQPAAEARRAIAERLLPLLPSGDAQLDRDLCALLASIDAAGLLERAVPLLAEMRPDAAPDWAGLATRNENYGAAIARMLAAMPPTAQIGVADALRLVPHGWTLDQRHTLFAFLAAARQRRGGASYDGYLKAIVDAAWQQCTPAEQHELAEVAGLARADLPAFQSRPPRGPGREWQLADAAAIARTGLRGRDFDSGRNLFHAASCAACHRFAGEGGSTGPDLTSLGNKFTAADVLQAILEPSAVVSDQYAGAVLHKRDGSTLFGRVASTRVDGAEIFEVVPATADATPVRVPAKDVLRVESSKLSPMPAGLVDRLAEDELLDLLAYLLSRGDAKSPMFSR